MHLLRVNVFSSIYVEICTSIGYMGKYVFYKNTPHYKRLSGYMWICIN